MTFIPGNKTVTAAVIVCCIVLMMVFGAMLGAKETNVHFYEKAMALEAQALDEWNSMEVSK